jgi:hypothetical protein
VECRFRRQAPPGARPEPTPGTGNRSGERHAGPLSSAGGRLQGVEVRLAEFRVGAALPGGRGQIDGSLPTRWRTIRLPARPAAHSARYGAKVSGTAKVMVSVSDRNGIGRIELLINGKVVAKDLEAGYAFSVNTKKYGKKIKIQLRAYDRAGNATTTATRTWRR